MAASSVEVDLLGEPRLKNGLTYYPGVRTDKGSGKRRKVSDWTARSEWEGSESAVEL